MPAYRSKHNVRGRKSNTVKKMLSAMAVTAVIVLCYTITVFGWFQDTISSSAAIQSGRYAARIDILADADAPASGDNLLWSSDESIFSYDGDIELPADEVTEAYIAVSSYSSTLAFQYQLELTLGNENIELICLSSDTERSEAGNTLINPSETIKYRFALPENDASGLRLQFRTAFKNSSISTASSLEELSQASGTVYLTNDIIAQESSLNVSGSYPNINLGGHTLSVNELSVTADVGVFSTMTIENGTLIVGSRTLTDSDVIETSGNGHVTVTLSGLYPREETESSNIINDIYNMPDSESGIDSSMTVSSEAEATSESKADELYAPSSMPASSSALGTSQPSSDGVSHQVQESAETSQPEGASHQTQESGEENSGQSKTPSVSSLISDSASSSNNSGASSNNSLSSAAAASDAAASETPSLPASSEHVQTASESAASDTE